MLWKLVDVAAVVGAVGLLLLLGPTVIGFSKWRDRIFRRRPDESET